MCQKYYSFYISLSEISNQLGTMFTWTWCRGHRWVWRASELSQQVKSWPSGPFIFLSSDSWKACSLEIYTNSHWESWAPPFVQYTELCYATWKFSPFQLLTARLLEVRQGNKMLLWSTDTLHWQLWPVNAAIFY